MKRSAYIFTGLLSVILVLSAILASCSSSGGPSGGLIGGLTGGVLGALGDKYIGSQDNNGSTTIQNANGSTTTIGANGQVSTTPSSGTNNTVNVSGTGTTSGTGSGVISGSTTNGNTIISSSNTGSQAWRDHAGLITGAVAGATAGWMTDSFRKKDAENKYNEGYSKAKSDAIKEFYWIKRDAQKTMKGGGGDEPPLQYRYYEVEVPAHTTSDGVLIDKHRRVIEVVE